MQLPHDPDPIDPDPVAFAAYSSCAADPSRSSASRFESKPSIDPSPRDPDPVAFAAYGSCTADPSRSSIWDPSDPYTYDSDPDAVTSRDPVAAFHPGDPELSSLAAPPE